MWPCRLRALFARESATASRTGRRVWSGLARIRRRGRQRAGNQHSTATLSVRVDCPRSLLASARAERRAYRVSVAVRRLWRHTARTRAHAGAGGSDRWSRWRCRAPGGGARARETGVTPRGRAPFAGRRRTLSYNVSMIYLENHRAPQMPRWAHACFGLRPSGFARGGGRLDRNRARGSRGAHDHTRLTLFGSLPSPRGLGPPERGVVRYRLHPLGALVVVRRLERQAGWRADDHEAKGAVLLDRKAVDRLDVA